MLAYRDLLETLAGRNRSGAEYTLDRIRALLAALDHPEQSFASWLIAGTNGKGSVAAMLESIARSSGERSGLTISPHLNRLTERIVIDGREVGADELAWAFERIEAARAPLGIEASFFECLTAMTFALFAQRGVTRAAVEIGLGGRLDANNVVPADGSAVVSIGLDHTEILGPTLAAIATEKAHVARADRPLVVGRLAPEALAAVRQVAATIGARVVALDDHLRLTPTPRIQHPAGVVVLEPTLAGAHQLDNAGIAALLALETGYAPDAVVQGIRQVRWRGRLQRLDHGGRSFLLDGAHNVAAAHALGAALRAQRVEAYLLVTATSGPRDAALFVAALAEEAGWPLAVRTCEPHGHRLQTAVQVANRLREVAPAAVEIEPFATVESALTAPGPAPLTLVAGSLYLVGEALSALAGEARDPIYPGR